METLEISVVMVQSVGTGRMTTYHVFDTYDEANAVAHRWRSSCPHYVIRIWRL